MMNIKGVFFHRRIMAYMSVCGLFFLSYGVIFRGVTDGAIGGLALAFGAVIGGYTVAATYDDHSSRRTGNVRTDQ